MTMDPHDAPGFASGNTAIPSVPSAFPGSGGSPMGEPSAPTGATAPDTTDNLVDGSADVKPGYVDSPADPSSEKSNYYPR